MKKLQLTRKIPEYKAYLWDGSIESYKALQKEIGGKLVDIVYHADGDSVWLTCSNIYTPDKFPVFAGQYIVFSDKGTEVMTEGGIKMQFDVLGEQKVYIGPLPLDAWNKSEIMGDVAYAKYEKENGK